MDRVEKAFAFAADTSKQLIALATGILTFSIAFSEKMGVQARDATLGRWLLVLAWAVYAFSIVCGIWAQLALTGELQPKVPPAAGAEPSIRARGVKAALRLQIVLFLAGTMLALGFGIWRIAEPEELPSTEEKPAVPGTHTAPPETKTRTIFAPREVLFENNRSIIDAGTLRDLAALAHDLATTSDSIYLEGYADSVGSSDYNLSLSRSRAEAVRSILVQEGVQKDRIKVIPYGETRPVGRDDTVEGRSRNRRVLIRVEEVDAESPNTVGQADG